MNELIKIIETEKGIAVDAKELYLYLGYDISHWAKWCNRNVIKNDFAVEGKDYVELAQSARTKEFAFSIEFAKKISMMAKTEKGETARDYFLECEKQANSDTKIIVTPSYQIENPIERAKAWIVEQERTLMLEEKNEKLQFRSDFVDVCFETDGLFSMEEVCKILKLPYGRNSMMAKLRQLKVLLDSNTPKQNLINNGYFKVVETLLDNGKFRKLVSTTYATQKGIGHIHKLLKP